MMSTTTPPLSLCSLPLLRMQLLHRESEPSCRVSSLLLQHLLSGDMLASEHSCRVSSLLLQHLLSGDMLASEQSCRVSSLLLQHLVSRLKMPHQLSMTGAHFFIVLGSPSYLGEWVGGFIAG